MSEVFTVFYCWQSDTARHHGRDLIREALDTASDRLSKDSSVPFRIAVHADTENEPGLCNIPETILRRLREADAIVSDLTFVAQSSGPKPKHCSNPNVLFELGYAFRAIGPERLICVMNEKHGGKVNQIFDLAHHRQPISYTSPRDGATRSDGVEKLSKALEDALRGVVALGLSGGHGGDDEIMHQRQLSEIESYWQSISSNTIRKRNAPRVSINCRPTLFRKKRWADAQLIEGVVRDRGIIISPGRRDEYPPQLKGNAPMNWGLYNDTYGDPWTLTYAGQFWTEMDIGSYTSHRISDRNASVSPEPPSERELTGNQWIAAENVLRDISAIFRFMQSLCSEFADSENFQWTLKASNLNGKWLYSEQGFQLTGPSKAPTIERDGEMLVSEFKSNFREVFVDFAMDLCDAFCRDGRVYRRKYVGEFLKPIGAS